MSPIVFMSAMCAAPSFKTLLRPQSDLAYFFSPTLLNFPTSLSVFKCTMTSGHTVIVSCCLHMELWPLPHLLVESDSRSAPS